MKAVSNLIETMKGKCFTNTLLPSLITIESHGHTKEWVCCFLVDHYHLVHVIIDESTSAESCHVSPKALLVGLCSSWEHISRGAISVRCPPRQCWWACALSGSTSAEERVLPGVPQGSVGGSVLFQGAHQLRSESCHVSPKVVLVDLFSFWEHISRETSTVRSLPRQCLVGICCSWEHISWLMKAMLYVIEADMEDN